MYNTQSTNSLYAMRCQATTAVSILAFLLVAGTAFAETPTAKKPGCGSPSDSTPLPIDTSATDAPKWECKQTTIHQDAVWVGKQLKCTFEVTNAGTADLQLKIGRS